MLCVKTVVIHSTIREMFETGINSRSLCLLNMHAASTFKNLKIAMWVRERASALGKNIEDE